MKPQKIIFILTLLGILSIIFIGNSKEVQKGIIKEIKFSTTKTTIILEENDIELVIFDSNIPLKKGNIIKFNGKQNIYKNKEQIIIDKIKHIKE